MSRKDEIVELLEVCDDRRLLLILTYIRAILGLS